MAEIVLRTLTGAALADALDDLAHLRITAEAQGTTSKSNKWSWQSVNPADYRDTKLGNFKRPILGKF